MIKKDKFLLLVATHGDEPSSYEVVKNIRETHKTLNKKFDFVIANPKALRISKRFFEQDLNRSAPGNIKSKIYEEKRAAEIKSLAKKYKFVIDIHASMSKCGIVTIIPYPTTENIILALSLGLKNNIIWYSKSSAKKGPIVQHINCPGIEIEHGPGNNSKIINTLKSVLVKFIEKTNKINLSELLTQSKNQNFYYVYGKIEGVVDHSVKDFSKKTVDNETFYPFLSNQYSGIVCYKLKKIEIEKYFTC